MLTLATIGATDGCWPPSTSHLKKSSEVLGPEPDFDTTYSTKDVSSAGRQEKVGPFHCAYCDKAFERRSELRAHQKKAHPAG